MNQNGQDTNDHEKKYITDYQHNDGFHVMRKDMGGGFEGEGS